MGTNQFLTEDECLVSANGKWFACAKSGNLRVTYGNRIEAAYFNTGVSCCYAGYNVPAHVNNLVPKWCTETGRSKVMAMLKGADRTSFNSDIAAALAMFDAGLFIPVTRTPRVFPDVLSSGGQCKLSRYLFGGDCVNRVSSCWEATNLTNHNIILQSAWGNDYGIRQWALIPPGQVMRFDNRGGGDNIWCVNCPEVDHTYVNDERGVRWGYWPGSVDLWRKWEDDSWPSFPAPGGCNNNLGLGSTH